MIAQKNKYRKYDAAQVRRKFTLIGTLLQNIGNLKGEMKQKWMAPLNKYIESKCKLITNFFYELTSIPPLTSYFGIDTQILINSPECQSIYIATHDLKLLTTVLLDDKREKNR
eukprot:146921_1